MVGGLLVSYLSQLRYLSYLRGLLLHKNVLRRDLKCIIPKSVWLLTFTTSNTCWSHCPVGCLSFSSLAECGLSPRCSCEPWLLHTAAQQLVFRCVADWREVGWSLYVEGESSWNSPVPAGAGFCSPSEGKEHILLPQMQIFCLKCKSLITGAFRKCKDRCTHAGGSWRRCCQNVKQEVSVLTDLPGLRVEVESLLSARSLVQLSCFHTYALIVSWNTHPFCIVSPCNLAPLG